MESVQLRIGINADESVYADILVTASTRFDASVEARKMLEIKNRTFAVTFNDHEGVWYYEKVPTHPNDTEIFAKVRENSADGTVELRISVYTEDDSAVFRCCVLPCEEEHTFWMWDTIGTSRGFDCDDVFVGTSEMWNPTQPFASRESIREAQNVLRAIYNNNWTLKEATVSAYYEMKRKYSNWAKTQLAALSVHYEISNGLIGKLVAKHLKPQWLKTLKAVKESTYDAMCWMIYPYDDDPDHSLAAVSRAITVVNKRYEPSQDSKDDWNIDNFRANFDV